MILDLLSIKDLKAHFFTSKGVVKAVDGVTLKIEKKEAVALVGESGCGKTTVAFSIIRIVPNPGRVVGGKIIYKNKDILGFTEKEIISFRGKEISMVFQDPMTFLNPIMKVGDQIAEAILLHSSEDTSEVKRKVIKILSDTGIPSPSKVVDYYPHQLSGGMSQRVLIAMALSCNPSLLIADEPTTALDVTMQNKILELINRLREELGTSLLLITHNLGIVAEVCDKVYIMYAGKIVESADVFTLFEKPKHPYTRGLFEIVTSLDEFKGNLRSIEGTVPSLIDPPSGCRFHPRCKHAKPICRMQEPQPIKIEKGHLVFCWLYG